ncbi:MAG: hypothetical protein JXR88_18060 [Clostridia bacterium]|nr:hypothetical protein [Clostridia bacterium]
MFKVSEVAEMLSVEKVKIFEALLLHADTLEPYISKERHLTYLSEVGVRKLENILFSKTISEPIVIEPETEALLEEIEPKDDHLDNYLKKHEQKRDDLRTEIVDLKRKLNHLDKELRQKDDAILNFQKIIQDDFGWMQKLDLKIHGLVSLIEEDEQKNSFFNRLKK